MKGQAKRFVDQTGKAFKMHTKKKEETDNIGFLDLWRHARAAEAAALLAGVGCALGSSCALLAAIVAYGELTSLFVQRHRAARTTPHLYVLPLFGGGHPLAEGNRSLHMDELVQDSVAFGLASVAIMAAQFLTAAAAVTLANWSANRMVSRLRWRLLRTVISQEMAFFDTNSTMNFTTALTEDMDKFASGVGEHVAMCAFLGGTAALGAGLALLFGWELALAALAVVPLSLAVAALVAHRQTRCSAEEVAAYGAAGRLAEEALAAVHTVRAYGGEQGELERYSRLLEGARRAGARRGAWAGAGAGLGWLLTYALNAVVLGLGAALCVRDSDLPPHLQRYHPGVMLTILFSTFMAAQNITMCQPHLETVSAARGAARSLFRLLARRSRIDALRHEGLRPERFQGDITFENLYFDYPSRPESKVLRGLNLRVRAGETVALVGASGCGKSTLLQLLLRLYEPGGGHVTVDRHRLADLDIHHFRRTIGVVGQEPVLVAGSILWNIALGRDVPAAAVHAAARRARAHRFISELPQGYATVVGGGGAALSGGQKQLVCLARALLRDPPILLLDEPTSALDPLSERMVQEALDEACKGRTTLVVSHRLSTIVNATRIVYIEQGAVLEQGTHRELMDKKGPYWKLHQNDMTHKNTESEEPMEDEEAAAPRSPQPADVAGSSLVRRSTLRESMTRGALRVGSLNSGLAQDLLDHTEPAEDDRVQEEEGEEAEEEEEVPSASSWQLLRLNAPEWRLLAGGAAASLLVGTTMPVFALLLSKLYGSFASSDKERILRESRQLAGGFALAAALCGLVTFLQTWLFNRAGASLTHRLRQACFANYLTQGQAWFEERRNAVGALCGRLAGDCAAVQGATGSRLGTMLQGVSTLALGVALAASYSWKMTAVSLLSVPLVMGGICLEGAVSRRRAAAERRALHAAARLASDTLRHISTVQSLGVEEPILAQYRAALASGPGSGASGALSGAARGAAYGVCLCAPTLGYAVSLAYGGWLIARDHLPYEYAVLVSEALIYGAWMLAEALSFAPNFAAARRAGSRIVHALRAAPAVRDHPTAVEDPTWTGKGDLEVSSVTFSYPSRPQATVLKNVSLTVPEGKTVAIVGASGSGKSTIVQLLLRNYDVTQGVIRLNGKDIQQDLTLRQLRAQFGLVQQEPRLFSRSIRDNIAYGQPAAAAPLEDVIEAAKKANVHSFVAGLPLGYDTVVSGGMSLSGGQKQRVCLARALLRRPRLLLLDEATSALDTASEKVVASALQTAGEGCSTLVVAHRLATVRHAHCILVMHKGEIVERGTHAQLLSARGRYWRLHSQQTHAQH